MAHSSPPSRDHDGSKGGDGNRDRRSKSRSLSRERSRDHGPQRGIRRAHMDGRGEERGRNDRGRDDHDRAQKIAAAEAAKTDTANHAAKEEYPGGVSGIRRLTLSGEVNEWKVSDAEAGE